MCVSVCVSHGICRSLSLCVYIYSNTHSGGGLRWQMAEFTHLVVVKFKEEVVVEDIIKGLEELVSQVDIVKSFVWGKDIESMEMLRQGFTHAFMMTFGSKDDFTAFQTHPNHMQFSATFSAAIEKIVLLDFPVVAFKTPQ
ncbi:unnamed protein product [Lactuca saligna]|uniref:Stress-response A/B barrel domain-containing protein n=2 Tax=Lactuca TaxID=4235 RepID=A0AA35VGC6_LACSI|nr:unnamed protein product [Lactuca saligna]